MVESHTLPGQLSIPGHRLKPTLGMTKAGLPIINFLAALLQGFITSTKDFTPFSNMNIDEMQYKRGIPISCACK
jgi:hypothetical protein